MPLPESESRTMRAMLSLGGLLVVVYIVMKLSATQLTAVAPAAPAPGSTGAGPSAAQQAADKVTRALEAGAAQRAADAASR